MTHPLTYRKASPEQAKQIEIAMEAFRVIYDKVSEYAPSRYRSLALTKIEEAAMWTNKTIAFENEPAHQPRFHGQDLLDGGPK